MKELKAKARKHFNAWIRRRDSDQGCITCGGPVQHACHLFSANIFSWLQFDEVNVNGGCENCNYFSHPVDLDKHIQAVITRHGIEAVDALRLRAEAERTHDRPDRDYYQRIINLYKYERV